MDNLDFLIKLIGPIFLIVGIGIMVNKKGVLKMSEEMMHSHMAMFMGGLLSLLAGILILLSSFGVSTISQAIISIIGLGAVLKGTLLIVLPKHMKKLSNTVMKSIKDLIPVIGFLYFLIGIYLCWMGY